MATQTPNMNLYLPTIGVDSGLIWEQNVNANSSILDGHNHSIGSGVPVDPSGININLDLPFNSNNATTLRSARFTSQVSPLSTPSDLGCIYVSGFDLYYNDTNGNQIQITSGGNVNATSSGISSGTATASFSSGTLIVNAASNTPANIQCASVLFGNTGVSGSKYITVSPPSAIAANYALQWPSLPAQTNVMTLDTSGNMSSTTWDAVGQNMTSVGANAVANTRTRATGSTVGVGGVAISAGSGAFSTVSSPYIQVTNLSVTITTSGRPVFVGLIPDGTIVNTQPSDVIMSGNVTASVRFYRNGSAFNNIGQGNTIGWPGSVNTVDNVGAGTYTYQLFINSDGSNPARVNYCSLIAYEL